MFLWFVDLPFCLDRGERLSRKEESLESIELSSRREFLQFLGRGALALSLMGGGEALAAKETPPFASLAPSAGDQLRLADGFQSHIILRWKQALNRKGDLFGFNNDFTCFLPIWGDHDGLLWVNHESTSPIFVGGWAPGQPRTRAQVELEQASVGGTLARIRFDAKAGRWSLVFDDPHNRRLDARTKIPFAGGKKILGSSYAVGTLANCSGGRTPWGTLLTCEENYDDFYREAIYTKGARQIRQRPSKFGWEAFFDHPPEHYGWVVEIEPKTGKAQKLLSLGRFAHEGVAVVTTKDGRCVAYMGDDDHDRCIYKFVASRPGTLAEGELFVADVEKGRWCSLSIQKQPILQKHFRDQEDVMIRCREAALWVGGTKMHRPEDIEVDPISGDIYICLTSHPKKGDFFGSILKISEEKADFTAANFSHATYLAGGTKHGFACPDNLVFNREGQLWMTNDMSPLMLGSKHYKPFGNNALYYIPLRGAYAGQTFRAATAPNDAEFTGPSLSPDGKTMFLSVQHPGEGSEDLQHLTSHWPDGGKAIPAPAVVGLTLPASLAVPPPRRYPSK
ncbi:MAG: DUF839 domain-containing protein [Myxococcales bacterium]|nr:DUF839 domain-containing protein [Myxococcales bacterium]